MGKPLSIDLRSRLVAAVSDGMCRGGAVWRLCCQCRALG